MQFNISTIAMFATLLLSVSAAPITSAEKKAAADGKASDKASSSSDKAATVSTASASSGLSSQAYNDFQISAGTGGDAEAKANAIFASIDTSNLAAVSAADLKVVKGVHDAAEDAEVKAFNPAIAAASGAEADALGVGKIQNKVLKLTAEVLGLQIEGAQGEDTAADVKAEQTKLAKNIATDKASAGKASTAVPFEGSS